MITAAALVATIGLFGIMLGSNRVTFSCAAIVAICLCARFLP